MTNRISSLSLWEDSSRVNYLLTLNDTGRWDTLEIDGVKAVLHHNSVATYGSVEAWAAFWLLLDAGAKFVLPAEDKRDLR